ncbi:MAG: 3-hydroxyisobutyrate dehydrogenase [Solirubrobacteraceae bacterium]|jgi:3-hydroxyisobutyrate dehydrogenase|nr:3-hydroxyisobutyrate dehydrogenase [Solirubrobacteraceae bacterium]
MPTTPGQDPDPHTIAVLGTGRMGAPIAHNLLAAGFEVSVWNRTAKRARPLAADGARLVSSPAEAARTADTVLTMLSDGDAVNHAMTGPDGALASLRPGSAWIQMATIGDEWTRRMATLATENNVEFVDAPVSGSDGPARDRQLMVLASGPEGIRAQLQPIFDAIGRKTLWLGPAGNGTRLKLVLNDWLASLTEGVAETIALTEALGLDPRLFIAAIDGGPLGSQYAVTKARAALAGESAPGFALRLAFKDVGLALDAARERDLELPITEAISRRWQQAITDGHGDEDVSAVIAVTGS